jgi:lipoyl(octanoyl) transferase
MGNVWRLLIQDRLPGYTQMAIDEALYHLAGPDRPPVLRFYTWKSPTLSLGFFQKYKRVVSEPFIRHNNIAVVRRITGGRAVLHDKEVTYALAGPLTNEFAKQSLKETYSVIAQALNLGLQSLGIQEAFFSKDHATAVRESRLPQCFVAVSQYEISKDARKIIGSAQKRARDRFIQHGSILLDFDKRLQNGCILNPDPTIEEKIAPLNRILQRSIQMEELISHFKRGFEEQFRIELELSDLSVQEQEVVKALEPVYESAEWTQSGCR